LLSNSASAKTSSKGQALNVVFMLADDLGWAELGSYGQQKIPTPHLDRLASQGMRFTRHYSGAPVCAPSRCSLMTGKHGGHAYIRGNREIKPEGQEPMPADTFTVGHLMQRAGYTTGITGKWGLGKPDSASVPNKMGFDFFYGYNCQLRAHDYYPDHLWRNDQVVPLDGKTYSHELIANEALDFIRRSQDRPFFLFAAVLAAQAPTETLPPAAPASLEPPAAMTTIGKDEQLQHWFSQLAEQVKLLDASDIVQSVVFELWQVTVVDGVFGR
jgi:arylsulfatase A-like enzyme